MTPPENSKTSYPTPSFTFASIIPLSQVEGKNGAQNTLPISRGFITKKMTNFKARATETL